MTDTKGKDDFFGGYGEFWNDNLQKIEEIHRDIEKLLAGLDEIFNSARPLVGDLLDRVHTMASIYAGYNTIEGSGHVMKLKALIESYGKALSHETFDMELASFLLDKIRALRDRSFRDFPRLEHLEETPAGYAEKAPGKADYSSYTHRWITFENNGSWFISPYLDIEIIDGSEHVMEQEEKRDRVTVKGPELSVPAMNLLGGHDTGERKKWYLIRLDRGTRNYIADRIGKKVHARSDIVTPGVRPFTIDTKNPVSPGRIKIFGLNHIFLSSDV